MRTLGIPLRLIRNMQCDNFVSHQVFSGFQILRYRFRPYIWSTCPILKLVLEPHSLDDSSIQKALLANLEPVCITGIEGRRATWTVTWGHPSYWRPNVVKPATFCQIYGHRVWRMIWNLMVILIIYGRDIMACFNGYTWRRWRSRRVAGYVQQGWVVDRIDRSPCPVDEPWLTYLGFWSTLGSVANVSQTVRSVLTHTVDNVKQHVYQRLTLRTKSRQLYNYWLLRGQRSIQWREQERVHRKTLPSWCVMSWTGCAKIVVRIQ
jgi:hypothetical protein